MKAQARMLDRPETLRSVDAESDYTIADEYVAEFCKHAPGLCFVETREAEGAPWILWRVEIIEPGPPLVMFTAMCSEEEARDEIAQGVS